MLVRMSVTNLRSSSTGKSITKISPTGNSLKELYTTWKLLRPQENNYLERDWPNLSFYYKRKKKSGQHSFDLNEIILVRDKQTTFLLTQTLTNEYFMIYTTLLEDHRITYAQECFDTYNSINITDYLIFTPEQQSFLTLSITNHFHFRGLQLAITKNVLIVTQIKALLP